MVAGAIGSLNCMVMDVFLGTPFILPSGSFEVSRGMLVSCLVATTSSSLQPVVTSAKRSTAILNIFFDFMLICSSRLQWCYVEDIDLRLFIRPLHTPHL